jgi:hypothetical protein
MPLLSLRAFVACKRDETYLQKKPIRTSHNVIVANKLFENGAKFRLE